MGNNEFLSYINDHRYGNWKTEHTAAGNGMHIISVEKGMLEKNTFMPPDRLILQNHGH